VIETSHHSLHLEAATGSASTSLLELSALGANVGLDTIVGFGVVDGGTMSEMTDGLSGLHGPSEKYGVLALGGAKSELVEGDTLSTGLDDSSSGSLGEAKSSNGQRGDLQQTGVVGDATNDDSNLAILALHVS
jgi:hypothetical protein